MELQDIFEQISSKVDDDNKDKVGSLLKDVERRYNNLQDDVKSANSESKNRKLKIRELEEKLTDSEIKIEGLSNNTEFEEMKKQNENLKTFQKTVHEQERANYENNYNTFSKHASFEKIKDKIAVPEQDGDKTDFSKIDINEVIKSNQKFSEYSELGLFETKKNQTIHTPTLTDDMNVTEENVTDFVTKKPAEAKQWLKEQGIGI